MIASGEPEASSYPELRAEWRVVPDEAEPASRSEATDGVITENEGARGAQPTASSYASVEEVAEEVAEEVVRRRSIKKPDPPPEIADLQTRSQRRRNLPLSQLKRVKPKKRRVVEEEEAEFRPLLPKTDRESVLRGEDYWIDYRELDAANARKRARAKAKAAPPDQFAKSKMRAEIVNPYKQNWILAISLAIVAVAGFIKLNPEVLDETLITFPGEL